MELQQIMTRRNGAGQNYAQPIIYEWEDEIAAGLDIPVVTLPALYKAVNRLRIHLPFIAPRKDTFRFVTNGRDGDEPMNNRHTIPCIIDFFERDEGLAAFYRRHSRNRLVLLSSPFDYQYLKERKCPLELGLFAYSLSDRYAGLVERVEKKYDIVLTGRQDPLLYSFFQTYVRRHPDVTYVKRGKELDNDAAKTAAYYVNGRDCLGTIASRDEFMRLQSQGRVTLYGVQGYLDGSTKGFYHMTPHFLEIIACGCQVIARYPTGAEGIDAQYYEFDRFSPSVQTYEAFEAAMDRALRTAVDARACAAYLQKHYTSSRVRDLKKLLSQL